MTKAQMKHQIDTFKVCNERLLANSIRREASISSLEQDLRIAAIANVSLAKKVTVLKELVDAMTVTLKIAYLSELQVVPDD